MIIRLAALLLIIITTAIGWFFGLVFSMGEPYYVIEDARLLWILFLNFFWLLAFITIFQKRKDKSGISQVIISYLFVAITFSFLSFYRYPFDSKKWKKNVVVNPAGLHFHQSSKMLPDLIESKQLIGQPVEKVLKVLGTQYDTASMYHPPGKNFILMYWITSGYDACDRLRVDIENDTCIKVDVTGCD